MLDPISALGLVGNVFQVLSFAGDLVSKGNSIYRATDGKLEENFTAEHLAKDLKALTASLADSQQKWLDAHGGVQLDADEIRLRNICDRCTEAAVDLNVHLSKLKVQDGVKFRRLKSYRQALIAVWREEEVDRVAARLEKYQRELDTHILVGLRKSARDADAKNSAQFVTLDHRTQEILISVLEVDKKVDGRLDDHKQLLGLVFENTNQILASRRSPSPVPPYEEVMGKAAVQETPLHKAAEDGDLLGVKRALRSRDVDVNARDNDGRTPLHLAKTAVIVRKISGAEGVRLNTEDMDGRTALHSAVLERRLEVIRALLQAGIDTSLEDDDGRTAESYADCPTALWLLKHGPEVEARAANHLDFTGLFHMAWLGDTEGVDFFLGQGAEVNVRNAIEETPLTKASRHGSLEIADKLLRHGADIEVTIAATAFTPLTLAVSQNRGDLVDLLLDYGANKHTKLKSTLDATAEACFKGYHDIARNLIERGGRLESMNFHHRTPLLEASRRNDGDWTRWLLKRGAKVDVQDKYGHNTIWHAANGNNLNSLEPLLRYGAAVDASDNDGWSPLGCAAKSGFSRGVELLADAGANLDLHQAHGSGYTAIAEAAHHGRVDIVKSLAQRGANLEFGSKSGYSALSVAAYQGQDEVVRVLAAAGADLNK